MQGTREQLGAGREVWRTFFLNPPAGTREPQAFLIEYGPGFMLQTHYHDVDEYQVVVGGNGTLGRHAIAPCTVHHARAWTPYGPIVAGPQGLSFLTLRAQRDSAGPRKLPEALAALQEVQERRPWQASEAVTLPPAGDAAQATPLRGIAQAGGPVADVIVLPPDATHEVAMGSTDRGLYLALLRGTLHAGDGPCRAPAVAFVPLEAGPVRLTAGSDGAAALVLRFGGGGVSGPHVPAADGPLWQCSLCGSIYDERSGDPSAAVAPGTPWRALPDDWRCGDCHAPRAAFEPLRRTRLTRLQRGCVRCRAATSVHLRSSWRRNAPKPAAVPPTMS